MISRLAPTPSWLCPTKYLIRSRTAGINWRPMTQIILRSARPALRSRLHDHALTTCASIRQTMSARACSPPFPAGQVRSAPRDRRRLLCLARDDAGAVARGVVGRSAGRRPDRCRGDGAQVSDCRSPAASAERAPLHTLTFLAAPRGRGDPHGRAVPRRLYGLMPACGSSSTNRFLSGERFLGPVVRAMGYLLHGDRVVALFVSPQCGNGACWRSRSESCTSCVLPRNRAEIRWANRPRSPAPRGAWPRAVPPAMPSASASRSTGLHSDAARIVSALAVTRSSLFVLATQGDAANDLWQPQCARPQLETAL